MIAPIIATVAVAAPLPQPLSYLVPPELAAEVVVGARVRVPLGRRNATGFVLDLAGAPAEKMRAIAEVFPEPPLFAADFVPFLLRAADYYRYPPGEALRTALPAGLGGSTAAMPPRHEQHYRIVAAGMVPAGAKQRQLLAYIASHGEVTASELRAAFPAPQTTLRRLVELGLLSERSSERPRDPFFAQPLPADPPVTPSPAQAAALAALAAALAAGFFAPFLLQGVTGSGKTEVYLRAIASALAQGKQALVLVPEIALTPQLVGRFRARFAGSGVGVAVLHSGLSDGERIDAWRQVATGAAAIVIGARSAVFAPLPRVGIIVVDEEHEGSYKQGEGFRYHARDLALLRGQMAGATVLLGSATPAVTTCYRAMIGLTTLLRLDQRVLARTLPAVELVDLRGIALAGVLAPPLLTALQENLAAGEQSLLLLNRRGFAPYILCTDCGTTFRCPNCEITLTWHQGRRQLRCHYCDYHTPPPEICSGCGGSRIFPEGAGTERLAEELLAAFPAARIARMDRDTTSRRGTQEKILARMLAGDIDILVGTQMVAKGHDFPGVTLVGVVNADSTLNFPDFRSAERTFSLLTQVAGRAGRGELPGRVLVQTRAPEHYAVACAARHDYLGYYEQEIAFRRELAYPPFGFLVNLVLAGNDAAATSRAAALLATGLEQATTAEVEVLGPAPCPLSRLRGKHRWQILLKSQRRPPLQRLLDHLDGLRRRLPKGVVLSLDVDPLDML